MRNSRSRRIWRIVFDDRKVWWYGSCHTYVMWPRSERARYDRENW